MINEKDGGPAFPRAYSVDDYGDIISPCDAQAGMSLRDYFAAKALQGMLASGRQEAIEKLAIAADINASKGIVLASYGFADAMLKVRKS